MAGKPELFQEVAQAVVRGGEKPAGLEKILENPEMSADSVLMAQLARGYKGRNG